MNNSGSSGVTIVVGGGLVGLATAWRLLQQGGGDVMLLEKDARVACQQSTHNSGVLHAGLFYKPGSEKAVLSVRGLRQMVEFCREHSIPHEICGKIVVATNDRERAQLDVLWDRGNRNGLEGLRRLDSPEQIREIEPHAAGVAAVHVPEEGIVDYRAVADALAREVTRLGGRIIVGGLVTGMRQEPGGWRVVTTAGDFAASFVVTCGGLHSDRLVKLSGLRPTARIVPFRGEYFHLRPEATHLVRNLVYPVPDPAFPFLGVHFTRMIHGGVEAGPNAVLAMAREGYARRSLNLRDALGSLSFPGLWRFLARHPSMSAYELWRSWSRSEFCRSLQRLVPEVRLADITPGGAGVRAQAMRPDGRLVEDFEFVRGERILHVVNAPSPAATASLAIGERIATAVRQNLAVAAVAVACWLGVAVAAGAADSTPPVQVTTDTVPYEVTAGGTAAVGTEQLRQIVLENEYLRAVILPEIGGRIVQVYDKVARADMFLKAFPPLVCNPELRHSAYNSQCGGIVVNFPCFHHGNSCRDNWNWQVDRAVDGAAVVTLGWTDPHLRQRVVQRVELRPGESLLRSTCRYLNLNPYATGFSPWINTLFPYNDDLQWIMPTQHVVPHGFNADNLDVQPWPWPESDASSICHWRNTGKGQVSVFALQLERDFAGVYYHALDRGTARIFDRREQPGLKLWHLPPDPKPPLLSPQAGFELWSSPALVHEDPLWWEGYAVRDCHDAWMPVHGSGGFSEANAHGAINLVRAADHVEIGACLTRRVPGAVVSLVALDGTWWRSVADLGPDRPLRHRLDRVPGRAPLELRVTDAAGELLISCVDRPDPGLRATPRFTGRPLNQAHGTVRSEQYHPLWRGATGDKQPFNALAAGPYREQIAADPTAVSPRLGLARTLLMDAQLRSSDRPAGLPAAEVAAFQRGRLAEAIAAVEPVRKDPAAAVLGGEAAWRLGDAAAAAEWFARAGDDAAAQLGLARALAAVGRIDEAATAAAAATRGLPRTPTAIQVAAGIDILRGRHADAIRSLERLVALDPVDAVTFMLLERAERGAGNGPRAEAAGRRVAELQAQTHEPVDMNAACERLGLAALRTP